MTSEDGLLFQFACSDDYQRVGYYHFSQLMRKFVGAFGGNLPSGSLQHAILGLAAYSLPRPQFEQRKNEHLAKAISLLRQKSLDKIDDTDLFTAYILWRTTPCKDEGLVHIKGMVAILNILQEKASNTDTFACLRPLFVEYLLPEPQMTLSQTQAYAQQLGMCSFPIPSRDERIRAFDLFQESYVLEKIPGSHHLIAARALFKVFRYDYFQMLCALRLVHDREENQIVENDRYLDLEMVRWKCALDSADSCQLLRTADAALDSRVDSYWGDSCYLERACLANLSTRLLLMFLNGPTILDAMRSTQCIALASKLVSMIRVSPSFRATQRPLFHSWLFLGGLALPVSDHDKSITPVTIFT